MSISERDLKKDLLRHTLLTIVLSFFGGVYEYFSHEVYSYFMIYAFAIPLVLGVFYDAMLLWFHRRPPRAAILLRLTSVLTLSVGSVFYGVLAIYGTTNALWIVYPVAGILQLTASLAVAWISARKRKKSQ